MGGASKRLGRRFCNSIDSANRRRRGHSMRRSCRQFGRPRDSPPCKRIARVRNGMCTRCTWRSVCTRTGCFDPAPRPEQPGVTRDTSATEDYSGELRFVFRGQTTTQFFFCGIYILCVFFFLRVRNCVFKITLSSTQPHVAAVPLNNETRVGGSQFNSGCEIIGPGTHRHHFGRAESATDTRSVLWMCSRYVNVHMRTSRAFCTIQTKKQDGTLRLLLP